MRRDRRPRSSCSGRIVGVFYPSSLTFGWFNPRIERDIVGGSRDSAAVVSRGLPLVGSDGWAGGARDKAGRPA
jgi:hypothetical protein